MFCTPDALPANVLTTPMPLVAVNVKFRVVSLVTPSFAVSAPTGTVKLALYRLRGKLGLRTLATGIKTAQLAFAPRLPPEETIPLEGLVEPVMLQVLAGMGPETRLR